MKTNMMNWSILTSIFFLSFALTSCSDDDDDTPPSGTAAPTAVNFPDANLEAQVKAALGLGANDQINTQNILLLEELEIDASNDLPGGPLNSIEDLTGLEAATNLSVIRFSATEVADLTPIGGLQNVTSLRLNNTAVSDLSPVSEYTNLIYFNCNTCLQLTDISPLVGNTGLQEAILRSVAFGNEGMATIANWTSLYRLNMRNTGVVDISVLADLMAGGALLNTTPGAAESTDGGAVLDLRDLGVDCSPIEQYADQIISLQGCIF